MKKLFVLALCFFTLAGAPAGFPASKGAVRSGYVARDMDGNKRWEAQTRIRKKEGDIYILTEKGQGVYSSFSGPVSWISEVELKITKEKVIPLKLEKRVFDADGNMIRLEKQDYDTAAKSVFCVHKEFPADITRTKEHTFTKDAINRQLLGLYTQKMLQNGKKKARLQMVSEEPQVYDLDLTVVSTEEVEINGRERRAYKLLLDPRLGILDPAKVFFPRAFYWHSAEPDFEWLRYEGLEGGIGSVKVELTVSPREQIKALGTN